MHILYFILFFTFFVFFFFVPHHHFHKSNIYGVIHHWEFRGVKLIFFSPTWVPQRAFCDCETIKILNGFTILIHRQKQMDNKFWNLHLSKISTHSMSAIFTAVFPIANNFSRIWTHHSRSSELCVLWRYKFTTYQKKDLSFTWETKNCF